MQKIPTMFVRDPANPKLVTREVYPGCEWVLAGEGVATEKWDGTACLVKNGQLYKRHELAEGKGALVGWIHWDFDPAKTHGHGWLPVREGPEDRWHREAWLAKEYADGTYELVGPRVGRNPHGVEETTLWRHGSHAFDRVPRDFDGLEAFLRNYPCEGIVFHHHDGRMAKIKSRDFGIKWPRSAS